jgi:hypothetical protein
VRPRYAVGVVLAAVWVASCRPTAGDASTAPSAMPSGSVAVAGQAGEPEPAGSQAHPLPYDFDRGCAGDVDGTRPIGEQLDELGRTCAPGLSALATTGEGGRVAVDVVADACIRIGIVSSAKDAGARAVLRDPGGRAMAEATSRTPMLVPPGGPVCVATGGRYEVEASSLRAGEILQVRVWGVSPPAGVRSE